MPGSDFGDERGRGATKCRDHRLERRQFTAVEASGKVEQVAHVLAESLNGQNPTGRLHSEALRHMLRAAPKLKMEIPDNLLVVNTLGKAMSLARSKLPPKLRVMLLGCVTSLLAVGALFAVIEAGFQIAQAVHNRSMASRISGQSWIVYDEDLVYRPRYMPSAGPKSGLFRVVILGDSLIGGTRQNSMVGRLGTIVNRGSVPPLAEFINTGVPGYTNYQELVYLKKYGLALQPDLVGVVFCLNDVHKFLHNLKVVNGQLLPATFWDMTPEATNATKGWALRLERRSLFLSWLGEKTTLDSRMLANVRKRRL